MDIFVATNNSHKVRELAALMSGCTLHLASELGLAFECDETGLTFRENALQKARALEKTIGSSYYILADDSGLLVDSLPGQLGIHTARYGNTKDKILTSAERNAYLLHNLEGIKDRTAHFVCYLVLYKDGKIVCESYETADGYITQQPSGMAGFGYDPVFFCNEAGCVMAELPEEEKNRFSHRGKAVRSLLNAMKTLALT